MIGVRGRFGGCLSNSRTRYQPLEATGFPVVFARLRFRLGAGHDEPSARVPVDLQAVTRDVKAKIRQVIGELEAIEQQTNPIFLQPRDVYVDLDMCIHQLESAMSRMRSAWWSP